MLDKLKDRTNIVILVFSIVFIVIFLRLTHLTIAEGEERRAYSENIRKQPINIIAPRGEILDRNGNILAGNVPSFAVQLVTTKIGKKELEEISIKIIDILDERGEKHTEFPIFIDDDGNYIYSHDKEIMDYIASLGDDYIGLEDAETVFNKIVKDNIPLEGLSYSEAQEYLIAMNITPPISISKLKFLQQLEKEDFLKSYKLKAKTDAKEAFASIRDYNGISEEYSDEDARKILAIQYGLKKQGYYKYKPLNIAKDITKETAIYIEEIGIELPGINVAIEPKRYYPNGDTASHIIGKLGKIAYDYELKKYTEKKGYSRSDMIGKSGIENSFESDLRGTNGLREVEVNAYGRTVQEFDYEEKPRPGNNVTLTIDLEIQKVAEESLKKALDSMRVGEPFKSPYGDYPYSDVMPNAKTGAVVAVDVNTGEVLALANYPAYNPQLFATGISTQEYRKLKPENPRDPISPNPMYNIATRTAVQPGSTFKMLSGLAAVEKGLSPDRKFVDGRFIMIGNKSFGSWMYNLYGMSHGNDIDLYKALEESVNYYFYNLSMDYDYYRKKPLGLGLSVEDIIRYANLFGLNDKTGIEISELKGRVPNEEDKTIGLVRSLKYKLAQNATDYFDDDIASDDKKLDEIIDEIGSWADENPSKGAIMRRLVSINATSDTDKLNKVSDVIKYDYFNQMGFREGDAFNLSIGQGSHAYTPVQMARYIAALANGGTLNELTLIKDVEGRAVEPKASEEIDLVDKRNLKSVQKGMLQVSKGKKGTARTLFKKFPIDVASKTGSAERYGKIPPKDEVDYLKKNLRKIAPGLSLNEINTMSDRVLKEREEELSDMQEEIKALKLELEKLEEIEKPSEDQLKNIDELKNDVTVKKKAVVRLLTRGYFEEGEIMRESIMKLTNNRVTNEDLDAYKSDYDNFAWYVGYAPYDKPEIAVVVLIFQGGHGGYGSPIARDIFAEYFDVPVPSEIIESEAALEE